MALKDEFKAAFLDETNDIVLVIDEGLRICESSRVAQAILDLRPWSAKSVPLVDLLSETDDGSLTEALSSLRQSGKKVRVESSLRLSDGGRLRVSFALRALPKEGNANGREKGRILAIGNRVDSSSESDDPSRFGPLVARVLRNYADPVFVLDMTSRTILKCNEPALVFFGRRRDELVGAPFDILAEGGAFSDDLLRASRFAYATAGVFQSKLRLIRKDGLVLACVCTNVALFDERGLIDSVLCILHDKSDEERRKVRLGQLVAEAGALFARLEATASKFLDPGATPRLSELGLSRRHAEIIALVAAGLATKAIAQELGLAEATVKSHLSTIYRKLEVRSRTELLRRIYERGYRID